LSSDGRGAIEVLVIDDHRVFGDSLGAALEQYADILRVHVASETNAAVELAANLSPAVVVADYRLRDSTGAQLIERVIAATEGRTRVVVLSVIGDRQSIAEARRAGASGYLTKDASLDAVHDAIMRVSRGEEVLPGIDDTDVPTITAREIEVLVLVAQGLSSGAIAERLLLSPNTVRNHVQNVLTKLETSSRVAAVSEARRLGFLPIEDG
jgi:DNA-binding NarL/FixJ family response regulator